LSQKPNPPWHAFPKSDEFQGAKKLTVAQKYDTYQMDDKKFEKKN